MSAKLKKIRTEIAEIQKQITAVRYAALTNEQIERRIDTWLDQQEALAQDRIIDSAGVEFAYPDKKGKGLFPLLDEMLRNPQASGKVLALTVMLNRQAIKDRFMAAAQAQASQVHQVADKDAAMAELRTKLYTAEVAEEAEVERLEAAGEAVYRRGDADPYAIFGISSSS
ncbi:hypothetical protein EHF36_07955 [Kerstersia gyiorum]|uniref:hypothetical protein n=1 Tax=Kerstersia gyiorum TaxID=206506 RepID=UPI001070D174|nr:hypothetical protein [Kerstersia gyiorum]QBR40568.1 hypothetical protein EHF36_07955 [Kerstersia gyiorum]